MRLKSLELHGFKSFPDRTVINFTSGVTAVIGPNGSGKSNISDAIRWVLGELSSKNIRGNKMEDVIFAGTEKRPAMGYAEVSLTIDNTGEERIESDYDEITITRRLYRSGDSEYLINNKPSRLRDIVNMFFNTGIGKTGYSIIGQGRISEIISQKSEDRRIIFEEAAGISKFRIQKQDAERRLREAEANMVRVSDIISELESRVGPLEKEAAKARIYLDLFEKKKAIDVALLLFDIDKINVDRDLIERENTVTGQELSIVIDALESLEQRTDRLSELIRQKKEEYVLHSEEHATLLEKKHAAENELGICNNQIENIILSNSAIEESKARASERLERIELDISELEASLTSANAELDVLNSAYNEAEALLNDARQNVGFLAASVEELISQRDALNEQLGDLKIRISAEDAMIGSADARKVEMTNEIESSKSRLMSLFASKEGSLDTLSEFRSRITDLEKSEEQISGKCCDVESQIAQDNRSLTSLISEIAAKEQRIETLKRMEAHFEGYAGSVKYIAEGAASGRLSGICGPISKLISTKRKYSVAIETALGANIQNIVVEDEDSAKAAIAALKRDNAGRATFYPLTTIKASTLSINLAKLGQCRGYIGIASDLVEYEDKYNRVILYLLGRTVVFDTLDNASAAEREFSYSFKAVTLDGQVINAGGSYTGGSSRSGSGILTRNSDIEAMTDEKKALEIGVSDLQAKIKASEEELASLREELENISSDKALASSMIKAETASLAIVERNITDEQDKLDAIVASLDRMSSEDVIKKAELLKMTQRSEELQEEIAQLSAKILGLQGEQRRLSAKTDELISQKNSAYLACSLKIRDINEIKRRTESLRELLDTVKSERLGYMERMSSNDRQTEILTSKCKDLSSSIAEVSARIETIERENRTLNDETIELEKDINELRVQIKEKTDKKINLTIEYNSVSAKLERINSERDKLTERLFEEYELTFAAAAELGYEPVTADNRGKKNYELSKFKSRIRELGSVNVNAIEEYSEVKSRYDFLHDQAVDIEKSKQEFLSIISDTEVKMRDKFVTSFDVINRNFKEVFTQLFGGGSANLYLSDPTNVLTSGIEIEVAPPGKIIKNLKLLSGGEQVFVAIAIFFAILRVNPSPFCLLDEIESALDEVNVDRFAEYAKQYSDKTQFIIITHRRGTMEAADRLYGITMQEKGISRVLSVNIGDIVDDDIN